MSQANDAPHAMLTASDRAIVNVLIVGAILPLLDTTLVNVALHSISEEFGAPMSVMQWVITAYTLAAASVVPLSPWLTQHVGPKRLWILCLGLFLCGAGLSALAKNVEFLIFARVLQGIATGLLLPTMQTIVVIAVGQEKARAALSAMSVPSVLAPVLGPLVGGAILQFFSWRWLFWLHVPICFVAIIFSLKAIPNRERKISLRFDLAGFLLLCPGLIVSMYGLSEINGEENGEWAVPFLAGFVLLAAFVWHAYRLEDDSLVDISLFKFNNFRSSCSLLFFSSVAYYGGILLLPLYLIQVGGYEPGMAGFLLALHGVGTLVARHKLPAMSSKWGDRDTACAAVFMSLIGSVVLSLPQLLESPYIIAFGMIFRGAGIGVLTILSISGAYQGLTQKQVAHASSWTRILAHLGATIGAAIIAMLVVSSMAARGWESSAYARGHMALMAVIMICAWASWRLPNASYSK